ncbi:hypothetical protein H1164_12750 [Thermoactinomyces daqus]|uniref:Uncharacterized protein n=1 Tax=Thermoactinomyces daqus TaxID=1329516 RepID=A0A7W1XBY5_9BACL|nr:hypothetical protein [Thermoactinomyces daqus]MBA4543759.1 hypothetical protein [Thermoactinomyces daqus]
MDNRKTYQFLFGLFAIIIIFGGILEAINEIRASILPLSLGFSLLFYTFANVNLAHNDERTQFIKVKSGHLSYIIGLICVGLIYLISLKLHLINLDLSILIAFSILIYFLPLAPFRVQSLVLDSEY